MIKARLNGLYAITADTDDESRLFDGVAAAIRGGARFVQYRDKHKELRSLQRRAHRLLLLCQEYGASLIINDDIDLCLAINADGVHLGKDDENLITARSLLGDDKIIGVSCYNQPKLAVQAQADRADYIAFGSFFNSETKPNAPVAPLSLLTQAHNTLTIPVVAIGGITVDNGQQLVDAGANALAVITGLFDQTDIENTAKKFSQMF